MKIIKTLDLSELIEKDWTIHNGLSETNEFDVNGECVVILQDDNSCFIFPITKEKTLGDYIRFVRSSSEYLSSDFNYGFLTGTMLDVIYQENIPKGACYHNRENEMDELKKDVESINKIMSE